MENGFGLQRQHSSVWMSLRDGDFEEEDVWDVLRDNHKKDSSFKLGMSIDSSISVPRNLSSAARMIPNNNTNSCNSSHEAHKVLQQSAPVNIPDWSKVYRTKSNKSSSSSKNSGFPGDDDGDDDVANDGGDSDDEDEDGEYNYKIPPHELIAKRLARSQISSFSVFEGVGRTLKGRDLSKVRNAVLTKTGFLESP